MGEEIQTGRGSQREGAQGEGKPKSLWLQGLRRRQVGHTGAVGVSSREPCSAPPPTKVSKGAPLDLTSFQKQPQGIPLLPPLCHPLPSAPSCGRCVCLCQCGC